MIRSLKAAFGLSLLAALVVSAMSVMSASAITSGHFTSSTTNTKYTATEVTGVHQVKLSAYGSTIECHKPQYSVHHTNSTTFQSLTVTPVNDTNWNCTDSDGDHATVHFRGCHYSFTSRTAPSHGTTHFFCPPNVKAEVTTDLGTLKFGAQTPAGGATYTNVNGEVTADVTASGITVTCHGACQIFGTTRHDATMTGSATLAGFETTTGVKSHITAT
jgi:hypothetical protein